MMYWFFISRRQCNFAVDHVRNWYWISSIKCFSPMCSVLTCQLLDSISFLFSYSFIALLPLFPPTSFGMECCEEGIRAETVSYWNWSKKQTEEWVGLHKFVAVLLEKRWIFLHLLKYVFAPSNRILYTSKRISNGLFQFVKITPST